MQISSLLDNVTFGEHQPNIQVLFNTSATKELVISFQTGQEMKEHEAPFPIVIEIFEGHILFGVDGKEYDFKRGAILQLEAHEKHSLKAQEKSVVRLSISKSDSSDRVKKVVDEAKK